MRQISPLDSFSSYEIGLVDNTAKCLGVLHLDFETVREPKETRFVVPVRAFALGTVRAASFGIGHEEE